jgi:hypothetical protein
MTEGLEYVAAELSRIGARHGRNAVHVDYAAGLADGYESAADRLRAALRAAHFHCDHDEEGQP